MRRLILIGFATTMLAACNQTTKNQQDMKTNDEKVGLIEITTFKLNQGITEIEFKNSALSMQKDFLEQQNGYIKRTLTVSQDSLWTDIVFWKDQQSAEMAMQAAEKSELVVPFMEKIDFNSTKMNLTTPVLIEQ